MPNIKVEYDYKAAEETLSDFISKCSVNVLDTSRKAEVAMYRALFISVLQRFNQMTQEEIQHFFKTKGLRRNRSTFSNALSKLTTYRRSDKNFKELHDYYFDKKVEDVKKIKGRPNKAWLEERRLERELDMYTLKIRRLVKDANEEQKSELLELINLRVKSWKWKAKDDCKVYSSVESISEYVF